MQKKTIKFFIYLFFLPCPFLNLFSQESSTMEIRNASFSVDEIQKITFVNQNIKITLKDGNFREFWEDTCYFVHSTVSAPEIEANFQSFSYYPNPVIDRLYLTDDKSLDKIQLYDMYGKLVKKYQTEDCSASLDLSDLKPGMYLVRTASGSFKIIKK